jgi:hypothetical protein
VLEASRSQIDESGGVAFGILRDRHAMELQTVPPRNLAALDVSRSLWTFERRSLPSSVSCTLHLHAA